MKKNPELPPTATRGSEKTTALSPNGHYPEGLERRERWWINTRRAAAERRREFAEEASRRSNAVASAAQPSDEKKPRHEIEAPVENAAGLALSGGGIRSATFCLGVLQALAARGLLKRFDYLSTVSGGGYIGTFLGAWISRRRVEATPDGEKELCNGIEEVEPKLKNLDSDEIRFLRENGRFLAPNGAGDAWAAAVVHVRNWLAMLVVIGTLAFALSMLGEALKLSLNAGDLGWGKPRPVEIANPAFSSEKNSLVPSTVSLRLSPFFRFAKWGALLGALPLAMAYWLVFPLTRGPSAAFWLPPAALTYGLAALQGEKKFLPHFFADRPWAWCVGIILVIEWCLWADFRQRQHGKKGAGARLAANGAFCLVAAALVFILASASGWVPGYASIKEWPAGWLVLIAAMTLWHFFVPVTPHIAAMIPKGSKLDRALASDADFAAARSGLTKWLARAVAVSGIVAVYALVDSFGQTMAAYSGEVAKWAWTLVSPAALVTFVQTLAPKLLADDEGEGKPTGPWMNMALWAGALLLLAVAVVGLATAARLWALDLSGDQGLAALLGGQWHLESWLKVTGAAIGMIVVSMALGRRLEFVNLSSHHQLYSARLTRAYLGASNPRRKESNNWQLTETVTGDQMEYGEYHPQRNGGPLHLINVTVNETISGLSNVEQKDRKGFSFTIGPAGLSVRRTDHALFDGPGAFDEARRARIAPIGVGHERFHMFGRALPRKNHAEAKQHQWVEMPAVGAWVGMSGAAFTTGLGARTNLATSLLLGLFNVRLGYWWDSEIPPDERAGVARQPVLQKLVKKIVGLFPVQLAFADEFLARFHGVGRRHWYLSDGGHFENSGCYELIRRRVPFIICCDCGCDPGSIFADVANLVRKARLDFGAEIEFLDEAEDFVDFSDEARAVIGPLSALRQRPDDEEGQKLSSAHAALAKITYASEEGKVPQTGWLLLIKPTLTDAISRDVLHYAVENQPFPQQTTMDQFFDEAQWESYRQLGWQIGRAVFDAPELQPASSVGWQPKLPPEKKTPSS